MTSPREVTLTVENFSGGLNRIESLDSIQANELSIAANVDISKNGEISKRLGWGKDHDSVANQTYLKLLGRFATKTVDEQILGVRTVAGVQTFFRYDPINLTFTDIVGVSVLNAWEKGLQYLDKFYVLRNVSTISQYDGVTESAVTGSPSGTEGVIHKDRLFLFNNRGPNPARLYFSAIANIGSWPSTNFIDVEAGDGEPLVALASFNEQLYIFKPNSVWVLQATGDPSTWVLRVVERGVGCLSRHTLVYYDGYLYFYGPKGFYRTDGVSFQILSEKINIGTSDYRIPRDLGGGNFNQGGLDQSHAVLFKNKIILVEWRTGGTYKTWVFHIEPGCWTEYRWGGGIVPTHFVSTSKVFGSVSGHIIREGSPRGAASIGGVSTNFRDLTSNFYALEVEFAPVDGGLPNTYKRYKYFMPLIKGPSTHTWTINDSTQHTRGGVENWKYGRYEPWKYSGPGYVRSIGIKLSTSNDSEGLWIKSLSHVVIPKRTIVGNPTDPEAVFRL